jgi:ABC-2 type transport system ATP-binding protein
MQGVHKSFRNTQAVRDLSLELPTGSMTGFLGPNGAGKSTTIRMLMSIIRPDSGTIEVLGGDALHNKDRIGYLPEERGLYKRMGVKAFLTYLARLKGAGARATPAHIQSWLDRVELGDVGDKKCDELSKGMQQKVQFIAAIIHEPDLVVLDEPFSGLDPVNADVLRNLIEDLRRDGRTILFSTHVLHQAERICDRFVMVHHGRKLLDASIEEIRERFDPRTLEVEFLDDTDPSGFTGVNTCSKLDEGGFELTLAEQADPQQAITEMIQSAKIRRIELRQVTLEEVFRRLVQDAGGLVEVRA